ncbi:MAG: helix-turn-helix domain-containing protein [Anaerosomatales bacterium]|nr:helix-turn-helix domain-containing protein [Anaerosomatales bacterium]
MRDVRDKILEAAAELFARNGYAGTTTRAIAERAGVNEVTLFRRFGSKRGLLEALAERAAKRQVERAARRVVPAGGARERLLAFAKLEVESAQEDGGLALRLAFEAASEPDVAAVLRSSMPDNLRSLAEYIADRQRAGEVRGDVAPEVLAEALFALTSSFVMHRMVVRGPDAARAVDEQEVERLFEVFWTGAAAQDRR